MTDTPGNPITREVILRVPRKYDIEIHVSKVTIDEVEYADVREYVISLAQYGRGIVLPVSALGSITDALNQIARREDE